MDEATVEAALDKPAPPAEDLTQCDRALRVGESGEADPQANPAGKSKETDDA